MQTSKKILAVLLASMMAASLVSCGQDKETEGSAPASSAASSETASSQTPESKPESKPEAEPLSFHITTVGFGSSPEGKKVQNEWLQLCSEKMGRELKPIYDFINIGDYSEKLKIICAGGDIPDLLSYGWGTQADLIKWGEENMFEELTQHMDKLPNYAAVLAADDRAQYSIYSPDEKLYAFYMARYQGDEPGIWSNENASGVRKDILDELNLEIPNTVEEFYQCGKKIREAYPDIYPMIVRQKPELMLYAANHTKDDRYYNGSEYVFGHAEDAYKEALMEMNRWYTEGLISPDYFTHSSEEGVAAVAAGEAFLIPSVWEGYPGRWKAEYPDQEWILVPAIRNEKYGEPWAFYAGNPNEWELNVAYSVVVSAKSKQKDDMLQLMDLQYSDEVVDLICWGIEGETYTINEKGEKHMTQEFLDYEPHWDEIAFGQGSSRAGIFPSPQSTIASNESAIRGDLYYNGELHIDYRFIDFVADCYNKDTNTNPTSLVTASPLTTDENEEYANIMTPVITYAKEQRVKFIKGQRSFDEWDQYLREMNEMGDIQAALDIYNRHVIK